MDLDATLLKNDSKPLKYILMEKKKMRHEFFKTHNILDNQKDLEATQVPSSSEG